MSGIILAYLNGYLHDAMTLSIGSGFLNTYIGIGMWPIVMALMFGFNMAKPEKHGMVVLMLNLKLNLQKLQCYFREPALLSLPMLLTVVAQNLY